MLFVVDLCEYINHYQPKKEKSNEMGNLGNEAGIFTNELFP